MNINYEELRVTKLRTYLFNIIDEINNAINYQINVDMLADDIENYSLDKIPTSSTVEKWINGVEIHRDVFTFRSRKSYSQDVINNLINVGFFEIFESKIKSNNKNGLLPEINGIQSIECLNCGALVSVTTNTCELDIQLQITYKEGE